MLGKHYFSEGVLWLNQQWHDRSKDTKIKMALKAGFSQENYQPCITQKRAGKWQEEYLQLLFTHQVSQGETSPGILTFSFS